MIQWKRILVPFLTLFCLFLFDGTIAFIFRSQLVGESHFMIPRLIFIGLLYFSFRLPMNHAMYLALLFGILYDSYYTGILGIYMAFFVLSVYTTFYLKRYVYVNLFTIGLIGILMLTLLESLVFLVYQGIGLTQLMWSTFFATRLGPTLLLNGAFYLILYYPLKKITDDATKEVKMM